MDNEFQNLGEVYLLLGQLILVVIRCARTNLGCHIVTMQTWNVSDLNTTFKYIMLNYNLKYICNIAFNDLYALICALQSRPKTLTAIL